MGFGNCSAIDSAIDDGILKGPKTRELMQLRRGEYMRPLYKKIADVVEQVAKENGYTQILTTTGNQFAYFDQKHDITKLVMEKMGIKE